MGCKLAKEKKKIHQNRGNYIPKKKSVNLKSAKFKLKKGYDNKF